MDTQGLLRPCCAGTATWARHMPCSPRGPPAAQFAPNSAWSHPEWTLGRSGRSGSARTGRGRSWAPRPRAPPSRGTLLPTPTARMTTAVRRRGAAAAWVCRCVPEGGDAWPGRRAPPPARPAAPETTAAARQGCGSRGRPAICRGWVGHEHSPSSPALPPRSSPPPGPWQPAGAPHGGPGRPVRVPSRRRAHPSQQPDQPANSRRRPRLRARIADPRLWSSAGASRLAAAAAPPRGPARQRPAHPSSPAPKALNPNPPLPSTPHPCRPRQAGRPVGRRAGGPLPQGARAGRRRVVSGRGPVACHRSEALLPGSLRANPAGVPFHLADLPGSGLQYMWRPCGAAGQRSLCPCPACCLSPGPMRQSHLPPPLPRSALPPAGRQSPRQSS